MYTLKTSFYYLHRYCLNGFKKKEEIDKFSYGQNWLSIFLSHGVQNISHDEKPKLWVSR